MMTHCLCGAGNLPIKTLVAKRLPTNVHVQYTCEHKLRMCVCEHSVYVQIDISQWM